MKNVRYSPKTIDAIRALAQSYIDRIARNELTPDEAAILLKEESSAMLRSVMGTVHTRQVCPDCSGTTHVIGAVQSWRCPCSPTTPRELATR